MSLKTEHKTGKHLGSQSIVMLYISLRHLFIVAKDTGISDSLILVL